jgi:hypothetical protein
VSSLGASAANRASIAVTTAILTSIACSTSPARQRPRPERKKYYGEAQKIIAEDAPYISIWNRTNVAVAQPVITGLHLDAVSNFESSERRDEDRVVSHDKTRHLNDPSTFVVV